MKRTIIAGLAALCTTAIIPMSADSAPARAQDDTAAVRPQTGQVAHLRVVAGEDGRPQLELRTVGEDAVNVRAQAIEFASDQHQGKVISLRVSANGSIQLVLNEARTQPPVQIGITTRKLDAALATNIGVAANEALLAVDIADGQAAQIAGVRQYDVITMIDGKKPATQALLASVINQKSAGDLLELSVLRAGDTQLSLPLVVQECLDLPPLAATDISVIAEHVQSRMATWADQQVVGLVDVANDTLPEIAGVETIAPVSQGTTGVTPITELMDAAAGRLRADDLQKELKDIRSRLLRIEQLLSKVAESMRQ